MTRLYVALIRGTHRQKRASRIFLSGHPVLVLALRTASRPREGSRFRTIFREGKRDVLYGKRNDVALTALSILGNHLVNSITILIKQNHTYLLH